MTTLYPAAEVAEMLQVSIYAVYKLVAAGKAAPMRTTGTPVAEMRFTADDVLRLLRALNPPPAPVPLARQRGVRRNLVLVSG
ncbi:helix-turn-helix domain-containing protein [Streptomyces sp. SID13031]|uniref:helix-turn-helix domain-containing protein n=1 Tax=Streptomyces sp. SID13031 TaxID=2706046 RepID=UPI0013CDA14E|nr:helix-turn-helix domain-containing protein [Streptomyces sp. SID13031]NEA37248.1 helix-turn-helix domain-containing protein [Streptomyces sp. SID13031]